MVEKAILKFRMVHEQIELISKLEQEIERFCDDFGACLNCHCHIISHTNSITKFRDQRLITLSQNKHFETCPTEDWFYIDCEDRELQGSAEISLDQVLLKSNQLRLDNADSHRPQIP